MEEHDFDIDYLSHVLLSGYSYFLEMLPVTALKIRDNNFMPVKAASKVFYWKQPEGGT